MDSKRPLATIFHALALGAASLVAALVLVVVCHGFFPTSRLEVASPGAGKFRAFTRNEGFGDMSINLYASDWPHTFLAPARIGDLYWPERYSASAYWSGDGSLVVIRTEWNTGPGIYFTGAYDFREHRHHQAAYLPQDGGQIHHRISSLLEARGGVGPSVPQEDGKGGVHPSSPLPPGVWLLSGSLAGFGLWRATRPWRGATSGLPSPRGRPFR